jgi:hypothetical protein
MPLPVKGFGRRSKHQREHKSFVTFASDSLNGRGADAVFDSEHAEESPDPLDGWIIALRIRHGSFAYYIVGNNQSAGA